MNAPDRPFDAPWQAQAFAMTLALYEAGVFTWPEWAANLGEALKDSAEDGSDYYDRWLLTLERILATKGKAQPEQVAALAAAWQRAAHATPHGSQIRLQNDPEGAAVEW